MASTKYVGRNLFFVEERLIGDNQNAFVQIYLFVR